jgi:hypothetical protein
MPIIKVKTGTTTPSGTQTEGEIRHDTTTGQVFIGNASSGTTKLVGSVASQTSNAVAITGGAVSVPTITTTNAKFTGLTWNSGERLYYDEGLSAASYTSNWNYTDTTNMTQWADLGSGTAHGWRGSASTYTLTLSGIPSHTEIMYEVYFHMVDSLDSEGAWTLNTSNSSNADVLQASWFKGWNTKPYNLSVYNSTTFSWRANQFYSYSPWGTYFYNSGWQTTDSNSGGGNGYAVVNTGWYSHTSSTFIAKHYIAADQAAADEAAYLSHVKVWIRGANTNTINSIATSVTNNSTTLPTQAAVKAFIDGNYATTLKNIYSYTGNSTYTKSGSDVKMLRVICVGAGGGGRGYHESGGGGGYAERIIQADGISTVSVTVGTGSGGGYYFGFSGQGGTTSFGSFCSATGGYGANQNRSHAGGHGGVGSGGNINFYGGGGGGHAPGHNNQQGGESGQGGGTFFGGGSPGRHGGNSFSDIGAPGGGAFGGAGNHNGGTGLTGICIVYEYK